LLGNEWHACSFFGLRFLRAEPIGSNLEITVSERVIVASRSEFLGDLLRAQSLAGRAEWVINKSLCLEFRELLLQRLYHIKDLLEFRPILLLWL